VASQGRLDIAKFHVGSKYWTYSKSCLPITATAAAIAVAHCLSSGYYAMVN
jgi:hypothetical protein